MPLSLSLSDKNCGPSVSTIPPLVPFILSFEINKKNWERMKKGKMQTKETFEFSSFKIFNQD